MTRKTPYAWERLRKTISCERKNVFAIYVSFCKIDTFPLGVFSISDLNLRNLKGTGNTASGWIFLLGWTILLTTISALDNVPLAHVRATRHNCHMTVIFSPDDGPDSWSARESLAMLWAGKIRAAWVLLSRRQVIWNLARSPQNPG